VSLRIDDKGVPTVVKHASGPTEVSRRRHEAAVLARLDGAPAVQLRSVTDDGDAVELELEHVPGRSLEASAPLDLDALATLGLALTDAVAELHRRGVVHLALEASHVLLPSPGVPVLCGLADAAAVGPGEDLDPGADDRARRTLLTQEVARSVAAGIVDPADPRARQLEHLVDPDRPAASTRGSLREALAAFASSATTADAAPQPLPSLRPRHRRIPWLGIAIAAIALVVLVVVWLARDDGDPGTAPATTTTVTAPPLSTTSATSAPPSTAPPPTTSAPATSVLTQPPPCPAVGAATAADVDGDGCAEAYTLGDGRIDVAGRAYAVGQAGDLLAVGDWDCDGTATPALVRPATGSVFMFAAWPDTQPGLSAEPVATVADPRAVAAVPDATGCDALAVETPSGPVTVVDPGRTG
jgi:hypothetical protein